MKFIKDLGKKAIFVILICLIVFGILLLQCFVFSKDDYDPRSDETTNYLKSSKNVQNTSLNESESESGNGIINSVTGFAKETYDSYQNTDVSGKDYNAYNFDDTILLYEGEQNKNGVNTLLERLIKNTDDSFYSRPSVSLKNFSDDKKITYTNVEDYKSALYDVENSLDENSNYEISFGYNTLRTVVNEIIITKK